MSKKQKWTPAQLVTACMRAAGIRIEGLKTRHVTPSMLARCKHLTKPDQ